MSSIICFLNIIICLAITYYYFFILNIILKNKTKTNNKCTINLQYYSESELFTVTQLYSNFDELLNLFFFI